MSAPPNPETPDSPRIDELSWGRMVVRGLGPGRDFKLFPGGGRAWDWNETGTRHVPGVQADDVAELIEHGVTVVVLSTGMEERLQVPQHTRERLTAKGIDVHVAATPQAVDRYNALAEAGAHVGGLFHSTC